MKLAGLICAHAWTVRFWFQLAGSHGLGYHSAGPASPHFFSSWKSLHSSIVMCISAVRSHFQTETSQAQISNVICPWELPHWVRATSILGGSWRPVRWNRLIFTPFQAKVGPFWRLWQRRLDAAAAAAAAGSCDLWLRQRRQRRLAEAVAAAYFLKRFFSWLAGFFGSCISR